MDVDNSDFLEFVAVADAQKLDYILIGGLALILNGAVRFTQDADIWLQPTNENRDKFVRALIRFGYDESDVKAIRSADFTQPQIVRIHDIPMDILTRVHYQFNYAECRKRAKSVILKGKYTVYFLHVNDLRETKVLARRTKDLNDILMIDELIAAQREQN
jgi:hypothetical protein